MDKKLLIRPETQEIAEAYLDFFFAETGLGSKTGGVDYNDFVTNQLGQIKNKEQEKALEIQELATKLQQVLPNEKVQPSGVNIRSNSRDVIKSLEWFFKTFKKQYTEDTILKATIEYGRYATSKQFEYISPLHYFIRKNNVSNLANMCETVNSKPDNKPTFQPTINSMI